MSVILKELVAFLDFIIEVEGKRVDINFFYKEFLELILDWSGQQIHLSVYNILKNE